MMPNFTFGTATTTFTGQNIGAGRLDRVEKGTKDGLKLGLSVYRGDMDERRSGSYVPREVGDHKRLVIFIADLQLSNPREATGVKFLNEAEAGHKSYVTIDFVPSSRSSAQKRSVVHHPADIIGIMPQRVNVSASASSSA